MTVKKMLEKVLSELERIGCIEASAIASRNGLLICSNITKKWHTEVAVAMCAAMLEAAERVTTEFGKGTPYRVIVESKQGKIILTEAGAKALLTVMTKSDANLGLVEEEMTNASEKIKQILG